MIRIVVVIVTACSIAFAFPSPADQSTCVFADGRGLRVQYTRTPYPMDNGHVWTPGNEPAILFVDTLVMVGGVSLPAGAYGLYILPEGDHWTLIINRKVGPPSKYDPNDDLVRARMGSSKLEHKVDVPEIALVHPSRSQCNVRIYAGSTLAWEEINEKLKQGTGSK